jgi:hypothetical protein
MRKQLHHFTLATGESRLSDRCEVDDEVLTALAPIVATGGGVLSGNSPLVVQITRGEHGVIFTIEHHFEPLVTCGLATTAEAAAEIWPKLVNVSNRCGMMSPDFPPTLIPWLSVVVLPGIATVPRSVVDTLVELEQRLAWAILDVPTAG